MPKLAPTPPTPMEQLKLIPVQQACEILACGMTKLRGLIRSGKIEAHRNGQKVVIPYHALMKYLRELPPIPITQPPVHNGGARNQPNGTRVRPPLPDTIKATAKPLPTPAKPAPTISAREANRMLKDGVPLPQPTPQRRALPVRRP